MTLTAIGDKNLDSFSFLLGHDHLSPDNMYIGAIDRDTAVGAGEFSSDGSLLMLDSLYVLDEYRRLGIATAMLDEIFSLAKRAGSKGVWADYAGDEVIDSFLRDYGFFVWEDCAFYQLPLAEIINADTCGTIFGKLKEKPEDKQRVCSFAKLSAKQINVIKNRLIQNGLKNTDEMIDTLSDPMNSLAVYKDSQRKELAAVLITDVTGDYVTIKYLANLGGNPRDLVYILKLFWGMVVARNLSDKILSFCTSEPEIKLIISKFAGRELKPTGSMMVAYKEFGKGES